jgi:hypothetical protein
MWSTAESAESSPVSCGVGGRGCCYLECGQHRRVAGPVGYPKPRLGAISRQTFVPAHDPVAPHRIVPPVDSLPPHPSHTRPHRLVTQQAASTPRTHAHLGLETHYPMQARPSQTGAGQLGPAKAPVGQHEDRDGGQNHVAQPSPPPLRKVVGALGEFPLRVAAPNNGSVRPPKMAAAWRVGKERISTPSRATRSGSRRRRQSEARTPRRPSATVRRRLTPKGPRRGMGCLPRAGPARWRPRAARGMRPRCMAAALRGARVWAWLLGSEAQRDSAPARTAVGFLAVRPQWGTRLSDNFPCTPQGWWMGPPPFTSSCKTGDDSAESE